MDLSNYSLKELLEIAVRSEIDAKETYTELSKKVDNFVLKDRLEFLAGEEEKHRKFIESFFNKKFAGEEMNIPDESPKPLPRVNIEDENMEMSEIFYQAMESEKASRDFYLGIAERYEDEPEIKKTIVYLASMEMNHYHILKAERDSIDAFEELGRDWAYIHIGP